MTPFLVHRPKTDRAFEKLYKGHVHDVYRYTLAVLHNEADAEDVTQATFLSAFRAYRRGERPVKAHNWLIKIAHNECRQRFRANARRPVEVALHERDGHARIPDEDVPTADEIRHALAQLSFNQRAAIVMRELEGRSYAEIASILEVSLSAVETLIFRARRALREQLEGSLSCGQAELTLARRLEGSITTTERGALRAHLRECKECAALERRQRAHRAALKSSLASVPLPASLESFMGGGTATVVGGTALAGTGLAGKVAAVVAVGAVAAGASHEAVQAVTSSPRVGKAEIVLDNSRPAAEASTAPVAAAAASQGPARSRRAFQRAVSFEPVGTNAAHRRTLRRSELVDDTASGNDSEQAAASVRPRATATSPAAPPTLKPPAAPPVALPPLPVRPPTPPVPLPPVMPPPPLQLPKLPPLPPLPPPPSLPNSPPLPPR